MKSKIISSFILSLSLSVFVFMLLGAPASGMREPQMQNGKHWYFLNRGWPAPWTGVTIESSGLGMPFVKIPGSTKTVGELRLVKIINLKSFVPFFAALTLFFWVLFSYFIRLSKSVLSFGVIFFMLASLVAYVKIFLQY